MIQPRTNLLRQCAAALSPRLGAPMGALLLLLGAFHTAAASPVSIQYKGLKLNGELLQPARARTDRLVLLVHGTLAHDRMELIVTLQTLLAERQMASLAITLSLAVDDRQGMYPCDAPHRHKLDDALDEIDAWLQWLQPRGVREVVLLGHSLGGNQVARFAAERHREQLKALVLLAPSTWSEQDAALRYHARFNSDLESMRARARTAGADGWLVDVPFLFCNHAKVTGASFLSYYGNDTRRDTPSLLPSIIVPTLVIAGSVDTTVPDVVERTKPYVGVGKTLMVVDGADHFFRDLYAEDVADAIAALVKQQP
jgi:pimeloyl-ACP methyl ester carboxylesterase